MSECSSPKSTCSSPSSTIKKSKSRGLLPVLTISEASKVIEPIFEDDDDSPEATGRFGLQNRDVGVKAPVMPGLQEGFFDSLSQTAPGHALGLPCDPLSSAPFARSLKSKTFGSASEPALPVVPSLGGQGPFGSPTHSAKAAIVPSLGGSPKTSPKVATLVPSLSGRGPFLSPTNSAKAAVPALKGGPFEQQPPMSAGDSKRHRLSSSEQRLPSLAEANDLDPALQPFASKRSIFEAPAASARTDKAAATPSSTLRRSPTAPSVAAPAAATPSSTLRRSPTAPSVAAPAAATPPSTLHRSPTAPSVAAPINSSRPLTFGAAVPALKGGPFEQQPPSDPEAALTAREAALAVREAALAAREAPAAAAAPARGLLRNGHNCASLESLGVASTSWQSSLSGSPSNSSLATSAQASIGISRETSRSRLTASEGQSPDFAAIRIALTLSRSASSKQSLHAPPTPKILSERDMLGETLSAETRDQLLATIRPKRHGTLELSAATLDRALGLTDETRPTLQPFSPQVGERPIAGSPAAFATKYAEIRRDHHTKRGSAPAKVAAKHETLPPAMRRGIMATVFAGVPAPVQEEETYERLS